MMYLKRIILYIGSSFFFKSLARKSLDKYIPEILTKNSKGNVLEIGALNNPYKKYIKFSSYVTLDIEKENNPTYIEDIHKCSLKSNEFDTIIMTEVLEHLYNPFVAIEELTRILKKKGTLIATTRFIHPYHGEPYDYFRFTEYGLKQLFSKFSKIEIIPLGNAFHSAIDTLTLTNRFIKLFSPLFSFLPMSINKKSKAPLGFIIIVKK